MNTASSKTLSAHRQRKHDVMVQKILEAARAIMREQGAAALSIQELARRLDLRAPSLYHYFSSKMEIYDALFQLGFTLFSEQMEVVAERTDTWQAYVQESFSSYLNFAKENPELYQLCFERPVPGFVPSDESLEISEAIRHQAYRQAAEFKRTLRTDLSAEQLVDLLIAMMHGITAMHMANEPGLPPAQGRFGPLIPAFMDLLEKSWSQP